jgi:hypothetical protein
LYPPLASFFPRFSSLSRTVTEEFYCRAFMLDLQLQVMHNGDMKTQFDSASCPTCHTLFDRLPVEYDEFGAYVFLEQRPCAGCGPLLCSCCHQFHCDGCGEIFCIDHLVSVPDGIDAPLRCCAPCAAECEQVELPTRIPPQTERLAPSSREVA